MPCSFNWMGKPQLYWLKYNSRNPFIRANSNDRNTVQAGNSGQPSSWSAVCMRGPCVEMAARFCFLNLSPLATRSLLSRYLLSQVHTYSMSIAAPPPPFSFTYCHFANLRIRKLFLLSSSQYLLQDILQHLLNNTLLLLISSRDITS